MEIVIALIILIVGIIVAIKLSKRSKKVYEGEFCTPKGDEKVEFGSVYFINDGNCVVQECVKEYTPENNKCIFDCSPYDDIKSTSNIFIQKTCFEECFNSEGSLLEEKDVFKYDLDICGFDAADDEGEGGGSTTYEKSLLDEITEVELVDMKTLKGKIPKSLIGQVIVLISATNKPPVTFTPDKDSWEHKFQSDLQIGSVYIKYTSPQDSFSKSIKISTLQYAVTYDVIMYGKTLKGKIPLQHKGKTQVRVYDDPNWSSRTNVDKEYNNRITPFTPTDLEWEYTLDDDALGFNVYVSYTVGDEFFYDIRH